MIDFEILDEAIGSPVLVAVAAPVAGTDHSESAHEYLPDCDEHGNPTDPAPSLPPIVDAATFTASELPEPTQLIQGMAHVATKMIIGGGSKSFKTWLQLDCALSIAYGIPWLGQPCIAGRVLFVNLEIQAPFFHKRIKKVCEARGIQQQEGHLDVWNLRGHSASYRILLPQIIERVKALGYVAIFLDPVYKLYGTTDENNASEVAQLLNSLERVCVETNALVAFGAHYSKGNQSQKEAIDRISGSGVFARDPDSIINFTKHEDEDAFVVEPILRNLPPIEPFVVRWSFPLMRRDDDADPSKLKQISGRKKEYDLMSILRAIQDNDQNNPISVSDWATKANVPRRTMSDYTGVLRQKGYILTVGEGKFARQFITNAGKALIAT